MQTASHSGKWWILVCAWFPLFIIACLQPVRFEGRKSNYKYFHSLYMTLLLSVLSDNIFISQPFAYHHFLFCHVRFRL